MSLDVINTIPVEINYRRVESGIWSARIFFDNVL